MKFPHLVCGCTSQRWNVAIQCFFSIVVSYMLRFSFSLTITKMTVIHGAKQDPYYCTFIEKEELNTTEKVMEFHWTAAQQGKLHAAFFWGYVTTQLVGGILSDLYNHKIVFVFGMLSTCVFTAATPPITRRFGWIGLIVCRILVGMVQGVYYNSLYSIVAYWIPHRQRATFGTLIYTGGQLGYAMSIFFTAHLLLAYFEWTGIFYLYAILGVFFTLIFIFTTYSFPSDVPKMSEEEQEIFEEYYSEHIEIRKELKRIPIKEIIMNRHVWAIFFAFFGQDWGLFTLVTSLPTYIRTVLRVDLKNNGMLNGVPFLTAFIIALLVGVVADIVEKKQLISLTWNRKIVCITSTTVHSLCYLGIAYAECELTLAVMSFIFGITALGLFYCSVKVNIFDLSPNFAGTVGSIGQMGGCCAGVAAPYIVGLLTPNFTNRQNRRYTNLTDIIIDNKPCRWPKCP
ncbi:putative inorganic phosphate cotransporter isoform X2 [Rhodnius prolixus]|uniref:putative inorganic phosphate cotransporter isoform X2 n=1 Tax=Rhodnius prolixus TaxID=13249 RepID=UPI003D18D90E